MGLAKLNVWFRDEQCRPFKIQRPGLDYVIISNCIGEEVQRADVPVGKAHIEMEVPPGCYVVHGHVCEPGINDFTDKAIAIVGCGQEVCVNLIVPKVRTCVVRGLNAFIREARLLNIPQPDIRTAARTILTAGGIPREEMVKDIARKVEAVEKVKEAKEVAREYQATLDILKG